MNSADGFILLTAPQTHKLVVDIPSVVLTIGLLAGHPLLVPVAADCVVEMVMHSMSRVILSVTGQAYQLAVFLSIELLVTFPEVI